MAPQLNRHSSDLETAAVGPTKFSAGSRRRECKMIAHPQPVPDTCYEPPSKQVKAQMPPGMLCPEILQCPRTASSGRRLIAVSCGGSYGFLASVWFDSSFIQPPIAD